MKRSIIGLIILVGIVLAAMPLAVWAWNGISSDATPASVPDADRDGLNDDVDPDPYTFNDRYVVIYDKFYPEDDADSDRVVREFAQFFVSEDVPENNIITLAAEGATKETLSGAIANISERADENDILFVQIMTHGYVGGIMGGIQYADIDQWLDEVDAGTIVITIGACEATSGLATLAGNNRLVYAHVNGEFTGALGRLGQLDPLPADTNYGNGDGYISVSEAIDYIAGKYHQVVPAENYSDRDNIYLTDYNYNYN